jgi:hypothetical protein
VESSSTVCNLQRKKKSKKALVRYYQNHDHCAESEMEDVKHLCIAIEQVCNNLKGKHA